MSYSNERYLVKKERKPVKLKVNLKCTICGGHGDNPQCDNHDAKIDEIDIMVRDLGWSKKNEIVSKSFILDIKTNTQQFNGDNYLKECIKYMIPDGPWGTTNDIFLTQLEDGPGAALASIIPSAFDGQSSNSESLSETKKEQKSF